MNFMFSWQEQYLTRSLRSLLRYCSCHSNIKFISSRHRVISFIYFFFLEREYGSKIILPSSFTWAWDQQDLTAKQVNPGGVVGIELGVRKKKFASLYCKMVVSCSITSLMISSSVKWSPASESCLEKTDSTWSRKFS